MNEYDQDKKAKIIPNSEINNEIKEDKSDFEDDFLNNPKLNFNYSYRGFKKISGWWVILFLVILISIPIGIIFIIFLPICDIIFHFYQTCHNTSPPTLNFLAFLLETTPFDVEIMEIPRPLRTLGKSSDETYTL